MYNFEELKSQAEGFLSQDSTYQNDRAGYYLASQTGTQPYSQQY